MSKILYLACTLFCAVALLPPFISKAGAQLPATTGAVPQTARVSAQTSLAPRSQVSGHVPRWAIPANDLGAAPGEATMHLQVLLTRAPQVQAAFDQRLADQQNPASPLFHHWLTPAQIGEFYGLVTSDLEAVTSWMAAAGLHVDAVAPSGIFLEVSAPAAVVAVAFHTSLHLYRVPFAATKTVRTFRAPTSEPTVPAALAPLIGAIAGLSDVPAEPLAQQAALESQAPQPLFTSSNGNHSMSPADFATIYDINPVYNTGITGTGYRVAIIGRSQVNPSDISTFETIFNLPVRAATVVVPPLGADPGQTNDSDQSEATLDVERVLGTAPGAQADLVVSAGSTGVLTAISYNVQTLLDPIMSTSFGGGCEAATTKADTLLEAGLFAQAAAEGISTFASAGDSGAADCDMHGAAPPATPPNVISINAFCASGFVTCVGGTEFADTANPAAYWSATNAANRSSALSYIPEGAWNDPYNATAMTYLVSSGGGGASMYFPKPDFQTAAGVVPADRMRDVPDISFSGSTHDPYLVCYTNAAAGPCTVDGSGNILSIGVNSGTSASAPSMAGIAALIDQKLGGPQGNYNPLIYRIASRAYSSAFHDATPASSGIGANCTVATASMCNNSVPSTTSTMNGQAGYALATGYDQATGWGSLDVANFLAAAAAAGMPTTAKLTGSSGTFTGTQTLSFNVAIATGGSTLPTGTVQFFANGFPSGNAVTLSATAQAAYTVSSSTLASVTSATYGPVQVTATYSGDANFEGSTSNVLALTLNPTGTATSMLTFTATPNPTNPTQSVTYTVMFTGNGTNAPLNPVNLYNVDGGTLERFAQQALTNNQYTFTMNGLTAGTHTYVAMYPGDGIYAAVSSAQLAVVSTALATTTTLTVPATANPGTAITLSATVAGVLSNSSAASTTVIRFFDGSTLIGSKAPVFPASSSSATTSGTASISVTLAAGTHSLTAVWPGDGSSSTSTSSALAVVSAVPGVSYSEAAPSITVSAGMAGSDVLTLSSVGGYSGSANLACAVSSNGTQTVTDAPTCSLSAATVTLAAGATASSTLNIATTTPHAVVTGVTMAGPGSGKRLLLYGLLLFLPMMPGGSRRRLAGGRRAGSRLLSLGLIGFCGSLLLAASGCSSGSAPAPLVGTTAGQYTVTVSGGAGTNSAVLGTVSLTVQ